MAIQAMPRQSARKVQPKFRIKGVYLKPLARDIGTQLDPMAALKKLRTELLRRMRQQLTQETFSKAAKKALSQAITIKTGQSSLIIMAHHPAWKPLVEGQRKGPMWWLAKARRPIPIITESGKVIFRTCTARSLVNGKWVHPGRQKSHFYDRARAEAIKFMKRNLSGQVRRQLIQAFK